MTGSDDGRVGSAGRSTRAAVEAADAVRARVLRRARRGPDRPVVMAYHGVEDATQLRRQVEEVAAHWTPIGLADVLAAVREGRSLPSDAVLLTFDDGRRSVLEDGLPVLRAAGVPAVLFVVAGLVGTDDPFWWDEVAHLSAGGGSTDVVPAELQGTDLVNALKRVPDVDRRRALDDLRRTSGAEPLRTRQLTVDDLGELEAGGIAIGNHSLTHPILTQVDPAALRREVTESRALLEGWLGHPVTAFAYPSGAGDAAVRDAVEAAGHDLAFAFDDRHGAFPPPDRFRISRRKISTTAGLSRLGVLLAGREPLPTRRHRGD